MSPFERDKLVCDLLEPIVECAEFQTLGQVLDTLNRGRPVAVRSASWQLVLPEAVIGYPLSRRVIDLPLRSVPVFSPDTPAVEAMNRLIGQDVSYVLVADEAQLRGMVAVRRLWEYVDHSEREQAKAALRAALHEKEIRLREVHHRVKNNLQIVSSLLDLQASYIQDAQICEMFVKTQGRVQSMALVHDSLYQSETMGPIDFAAYVQALAHQLFQCYSIDPERIRLQIHTEKILLDISKAIPCGLILNELVSNALKHGFADGRSGYLAIDLKEVAGGLVSLVVRDNGSGIPTELDFRHTESLGMQLVCTLANQLEGMLVLDREGGTTFTLTFAP
ncbi:MAG TPA: histidine kinase dimerization/phosphoacceptor domain -containing protein [Alphaproteobacteria bacterium]|nr:histidine kinase dimerization/phosphoacceptor domain -containing protein [Alphaproteobacteria bacterium]